MSDFALPLIEDEDDYAEGDWRDVNPPELFIGETPTPTLQEKTVMKKLVMMFVVVALLFCVSPAFSEPEEDGLVTVTGVLELMVAEEEYEDSRLFLNLKDGQSIEIDSESDEVLEQLVLRDGASLTLTGRILIDEESGEWDAIEVESFVEVK